MDDDGPAAPLAARIEAELNEQGHGMQWLEDTSGVSRSTIYRWRRSTKPPTAEKVNKVAAALGIPEAEARQLAGIRGVAVGTEEVGKPAHLTDVDTDVLLAEIRRRIPD